VGLPLDSSGFSAASHRTANYRGSYITEPKEIADIEIAMCQGAGIILAGALTISLHCNTNNYDVTAAQADDLSGEAGLTN
jgi:hypothetical protein